MFSSEICSGSEPSPQASMAAATPRRAASGSLVLVEAGSRLRPGLEAFIAGRFLDVYAAHVRHFLPRLFGAYDESASLVAAFGLRNAAQGALFLEQYLDAPVEAMVQARFGQDVPRARIAEVGNLAGATPGALRALIPALTQRLAYEGFGYVAFTGSARLCNGFSRLGLPLSVVAAAPPDRLPEAERAHWGRYYDHSPSVMLGDIGEGMRLLAAMAQDPAQLRAQLAPLARVGAP